MAAAPTQRTVTTGKKPGVTRLYRGQTGNVRNSELRVRRDLRQAVPNAVALGSPPSVPRRLAKARI